MKMLLTGSNIMVSTLRLLDSFFVAHLIENSCKPQDRAIVCCNDWLGAMAQTWAGYAFADLYSPIAPSTILRRCPHPRAKPGKTDRPHKSHSTQHRSASTREYYRRHCSRTEE
jgi:hypothetical protein